MKRKSLLFFLLAAMFLPLAVNAQSLFTEDFEGGEMPEGWTTDGSGSWSVATAVNSTHPSSAGEGTYCAQIKHGTTGATTKLITPEIDLSSVTSAELSFMHAQQSWSGDIDGLKVYYRTSSSGTWTQIAEYTDAYASWTTESIILPNTSATYQIAFEYIDNYGYGLGIDYVDILPPASCPTPTLGEAQYIEMEQASIQWTENGTATNWVLQYSTASDFTGATSVNRSGIPALVIDDLTPATTYYVRVKADCGGGDQSDWSNVISFTTNLCLDEDKCAINIELSDSYGDGWNGGVLQVVDVLTESVLGSYTISSGSSATYTLNVCDGRTINFVYTAGSYGTENGWVITDINDEIISEHEGCNSGCTPTNGIQATYTVNCTPTACPKPKNLALSTDGTSVTATWTDAANANIDIDGTVIEDVTSPYTFDAELSTTYTVKVQADCGNNGTSDWTDPVSVTTPACIGGHTIEYNLVDSYGDGWNGASISVYEGCGTLLDNLTVSGSSNSGTLTICADYVEFIWNSGSYDSECSFTFSEGGTTLFTKPSSISDGMVLYTIGDQSCAKPTGLAEANITINSADLSWTGESDSYVVEYTPWNAAGADVLPTATMTTYTFPLDGTGTGSVVIRHYDVTNMFRLIVDDIVVKDANGNTIYTQNFETSDGSMPAEFTTVDMDGDGYGWEVVSSDQSYVNGSYGLSSASWTSTAGALYPDNWIILSGIQLGGSISFQARGQDPDFAAEKFCVYVCAESAATQVTAARTSTALENLTPNTPYSWNVIGVCGNEQSCPSFTNIFITLDDVMVFMTEGNWNDAANWDVNRVPTAEDKVRLDADATIPAGVVAYALKIVNSGTGTVTIKDGGQLKQADNAVVTIEKEIEGYGEGNEAAADHYYFIATPLTESLFSYQSDWAYVDITSSGTYDLYSFDPTQELEWLNFNSEENTGEDFDRLYNGQGYLYGNQDGYTLHFTGSTAVASLNNIVTKDFEYATGGFNGWTLVGNPFTCNAYLSYVDGEDVLNADFYALNNSNTYTLLSSSDALAPCTGAFVCVNTSGTIQFASEAPAGKNTGMINMTLSRGNKNVDQARVRFGEGHNLQHMSFRDNSKLYMPVDGNDYAVVYTENQGEMPVSFKAEENGTYTLGFNTENVELGYLHLIDNMTGADVDLLSTPSYSFEARTTDYASRFKLVFATGNADDMFAFYSNGSFVINNEGAATLQVMDINGRVLSSESINGCTSLNVNVAQGVYMLRLVNGESVKVQKVVVR